MAEMLLINPRKRRRKARKARRRVRRNPVVARAANPLRKRRRIRRRNPVGARRRRRNPAVRGGALLRGFMPMIQNAAIGAAGSITVDFLMGKLNPMLPPTLQVVPGTVGAGDAVKAVVTVAAGQLLSKFTRGMSRTAAQGALTVQMDKIVRSFLPVDIRSQLAYATAAPVIQGSARIPPPGSRLNAFTKGAPMLSAYMKPGVSPVLNGARSREGAIR